MILITSSKPKQLLSVRYIGRIEAHDFRKGEKDLLAELKELAAGYTLLGDFTQLEVMDPDCARELGRMMEILAKAGLGRVVRVMPDARKDIGLSILGAFHYPKSARIVTCKSLTEAAEVLESSK